MCVFNISLVYNPWEYDQYLLNFQALDQVSPRGHIETLTFFRLIEQFCLAWSNTRVKYLHWYFQKSNFLLRPYLESLRENFHFGKMLDVLFFATSALTIYHAEFWSAVSLDFINLFSFKPFRMGNFYLFFFFFHY